jgi:hypothetical protein
MYGQSVPYGQMDTVPEFSTAVPEYSKLRREKEYTS